MKKYFRLQASLAYGMQPAMSERLTNRNPVQGPRWVSWIPCILLFLSALVLSAGAPASWPDPGTGNSLHANLTRALIALLSPENAAFVHVLLALLLLWGAGLLVSNLLPQKTPKPARVLAQSLGILTLLVVLTPWLRDLLLPAALLPALTALVWAQITLLQSRNPGKHPRAALAGLLTGLAAGFSLFISLGTISLGVWLVTDLIRKTENAPRRTAFFLAGALVAILPFASELPARLQEVPFSPENGFQSLTPLYSLFGIGGLLLIFLGLLVGTLQKNRILLTYMLATGLLFKAGHIALTDPTSLHTGAILFYPALLCAYGVFRILKGIESGVHAVNPAKSKQITLVFLILLLIAAKLWTARIFQLL